MPRCALAALLALALALTGCGSSGERAGEVSLALSEDPDELDPTISSTFVSRMVFAHMCEKLYDVDADKRAVPQLAAALPRVSDDGRTVTIRLRRGLRFNDGTPLDARAVKVSLDRHRNLEASSRSGELASVEAIDAVDRTTVRLRLSAPSAPLLSLLADRAGMVMSPRQLDRLGDKFATDPVCVGPFSFVERVASDRIVLEKSRFYYAADQVRPRRLVFRIITDGSVRASNLRSGDVDIAERLEPVDVVSVRRDSSIELTETTSIGYQGITVNLKNAEGVGKPYRPLKTPLAAQPKLREAFELALDREIINKVVFFDQFVPGCSPISPSSEWADRALRCPGRDVARAKRLVAESGARTPVRVPLVVEASSQATRLGEVIQAMAKEAGFDVRIEPTEFTTTLDRADAGDFEALTLGWSGRVDPDGNLYNHQHSDGPLNYGGGSDAAVDRLLDDARKTDSTDERMELYRRVEGLLRRRRNVIYLYHEKLYTGARDGISGLRVTPDGLPRLIGVQRRET